MKTVHLAVYDTLADWETGLAVAHIHGGAWQRGPEGFRVVTVSETGDPVTTMGGLRVTPDLALDDLRASDSEMLMLPGADTWLEGGNTVFADRAREFLDAGVPVAAICGATTGLAAAGLLNDRKHTSNAPMALDVPGYTGADLYQDLPAVTDRDVITAGATSPTHFAQEIFARLDLYPPQVIASWFKLYGSSDPAGFYELVESTRT